MVQLQAADDVFLTHSLQAVEGLVNTYTDAGAHRLSNYVGGMRSRCNQCVRMLVQALGNTLHKRNPIL